jgi:hypothetical protein
LNPQEFIDYCESELNPKSIRFSNDCSSWIGMKLIERGIENNDKDDVKFGFIHIHRSHYLDVFYNYCFELLKMGCFKKHFLDCWIDCEFPYNSIDIWISLWGIYKNLCYDYSVIDDFILFEDDCEDDIERIEQDKRTFNELPDEFVVYRGGNPDSTGISWTLSKEKGEWFKNRFNGLNGIQNSLMTKKIRKSDVVFYSNRRGEQEIVLLPK